MSDFSHWRFRVGSGTASKTVVLALRGSIPHANATLNQHDARFANSERRGLGPQRLWTSSEAGAHVPLKTARPRFDPEGVHHFIAGWCNVAYRAHNAEIPYRIGPCTHFIAATSRATLKVLISPGFIALCGVELSGSASISVTGVSVALTVWNRQGSVRL